MTEKILFVDDEPNILEGIRRQLRGCYNIVTATGAHEAFEKFQNQGPIAVVISDMRMPVTSGVQFLEQVRERYPLTVRLMLSGNSDQDTAIQAVNRGQIFQFLNKPCETEDLKRALNAGLEQHHLLTAERDLLQNTLTGSVQVLTEILSMSDPEAFADGIRMRELVRGLANAVGLNATWDLELAAMLGNIGLISVPSEVAEKFRKGKPLRTEEEEMLRKVPTLSRDLIAKVPRLKSVALLVEDQFRFVFDGPAYGDVQEIIPIGQRILRLAKDYLRFEVLFESEPRALGLVLQRDFLYGKDLLQALRELRKVTPESAVELPNIGRSVELRELRPGQKLLAAVETKDGKLLLPAGQELTAAHILRIENFERLVGIRGPFLVETPVMRTFQKMSEEGVPEFKEVEV